MERGGGVSRQSCYNHSMITAYVQQALSHAAIEALDDGTYVCTVGALAGVMSTGASKAECLDELVEVIEEWILVRVSRGLPIPSLNGVAIEVKQAS